MFKSNNVPDRMPGQHAFSQGLEQSERLEDKKKISVNADNAACVTDLKSEEGDKLSE